MTKSPRSGIEHTDLPITLYLNQRLTFDLLAALDRGFSRLTHIRTTTANESSSELAGQAQLGLSNTFALLGIQFGGEGSGSKRSQQGRLEHSDSDIVHTPASLFARLRSDLRDRELVREISSPDQIATVKPGEFVEFQAVLRRVPLVQLLSAFSEMAPLMGQFNTPSNQGSNSGRPRRRNRGRSSSSDTMIRTQAEAMLKAVTAEHTEDLIAQMNEAQIVLTIETSYFMDRSMNDMIDGTFRVFGKASRVAIDESQEINLLRKSPVGQFRQMADQLVNSMTNLEGIGFEDDVGSTISGPTMQVIPIAVFL